MDDKGRDEVSATAIVLWEELRDVIKNEEAWAIIQKRLDEYKTGLTRVDESV